VFKLYYIIHYNYITVYSEMENGKIRKYSIITLYHTQTHTHTHIYIYMRARARARVCVCKSILSITKILLLMYVWQVQSSVNMLPRQQNCCTCFSILPSMLSSFALLHSCLSSSLLFFCFLILIPYSSVVLFKTYIILCNPALLFAIIA